VNKSKYGVILAGLVIVTLCILAGNSDKKITDDNYARITIGMTEAQVKTILGNGHPFVTEVARVGFTMWIWRENWGKRERTIFITFVDGKVDSKDKNGF